MANTAFMEGIHAAKKGKKVLDNPYHWLNNKPNADLWEVGFIFELERQCGMTASDLGYIAG